MTKALIRVAEIRLFGAKKKTKIADTDLQHSMFLYMYSDGYPLHVLPLLNVAIAYAQNIKRLVSIPDGHVIGRRLDDNSPISNTNLMDLNALRADKFATSLIYVAKLLGQPTLAVELFPRDSTKENPDEEFVNDHDFSYFYDVTADEQNVQYHVYEWKKSPKTKKGGWALGTADVQKSINKDSHRSIESVTADYKELLDRVLQAVDKAHIEFANNRVAADSTPQDNPTIHPAIAGMAQARGLRALCQPY